MCKESLVDRIERHRFEVWVFAIVFVGMAIVGALKPSDTDEGYYATAAELVGRGRVPYRDFFYPQAPLLPYLLAPFARIAPSFVALHVAMALFPAAIGTTVASMVRSETRSTRAAVVSIALVFTHELGWQWLGAIKTYGPSTFFGIAAIVLCGKRTMERQGLHFLLAGACAAIAVGTRLMLAPIVLACLAALMLRGTRFSVLRLGTVIFCAFWLLRFGPLTPYRAFLATALAGCALLIAKGAGAKIVHCAWFVAGLTIASLPMLYFWSVDPAAFVFDNIGYHAVRADGGLVAPAATNLPLFREMLGLAQVADLSPAAPQWILLYVLNAVALLRSKGATHGALLAAAFLGLVSVMPNPAHEQYFATLVPFLGMGADVGFAHAARGGFWVRASIAPTACVIVYVLLAGPSFERKVVYGKFGEWDMKESRPLRLDAARMEVQKAAAKEEGLILPTWPGSMLGIADRILPGYENQFARDVGGKLNPKERREHRLTSHADMLSKVDNRSAVMVILGPDLVGDDATSLRRELARCDYRPVGSIVAATEIYVRDPNGECQR